MPHDRKQNFILVPARKSRPSGKWAKNDYDVCDHNAKVVGRIFRATVTPPGRPWFWTITERTLLRPTDRGYTATREEAMEEFTRAWRGE